MDSRFKLREATNADIDVVKALVFSVLEEYAIPRGDGSTDADLDDIEGNYSSNGGYFTVVEQGGVIVASMGVLRITTETCELRKMYSVPEVRGRGLGKFLLDLALVKARELGFRRMVLETASPLKEAIALYKKYGFQEYQPDQIADRCDQAYELLLNEDSK